MGPVEVEISMSVDGFITGPNEEGAGLGEEGEILHAWFRQDPDGPRLLDDALFATSGAVITSRKIYDGTEGWGDDGFYRMPVFVLTHRPHDVVVKGETTFTFVTDGIESAIAQARAAAGDKKVHVMGRRQRDPAGLAGRAGGQPAPARGAGRARRRHQAVRKPHRPDRAGANRGRGIPIRDASEIPRAQITPKHRLRLNRGALSAAIGAAVYGPGANRAAHSRFSPQENTGSQVSKPTLCMPVCTHEGGAQGVMS